MSKFVRDYGDVGRLPTPAFFYGLKPGEEISVDIEEGKTLFIKLSHLGEVDKDGRRAVTFELNGMTREAAVTDRSVQPKAKSPPQGRPRRPAASGRAHSRPDYVAGRQRRRQSGQGRQIVDPGGDENAEHHLRPRPRHGGRDLRASRRHGGEQGLVD